MHDLSVRGKRNIQMMFVLLFSAYVYIHLRGSKGRGRGRGRRGIICLGFFVLGEDEESKES